MIGSLCLSDLQSVMPAQLSGGDASFSSVSTDTRSLKSGDLYVALSGANFDGNRFVAQAKESGAVAAVVSHHQAVDLPQLEVADTAIALGWLGSLNRRKSAATIVAVTGSQGKTSVKEIAGAILNEQFNVLVTEGNLNNTIGAPIMLLRLDPGHERAVIELGANAPGEIAWTAKITDPHIVLINNAAETHLEGFGSLAGVVQAKGEIIDSGLLTHTVVLNADDVNTGAWTARAGHRKVRLFSVQENADARVDYFARDIQTHTNGSGFTLVSPAGEIVCFLPLLGRHNVANAVAAAALTLEAGASLTAVAAALKNVKAVPGRVSPMAGVNGSALLDDTYNASPASFRAAIDVLADVCLETGKQSLLIMGDMAELGTQAVAAHREVGEYAADRNIDMLVTIGEFSQFAHAGFTSAARHFEDRRALIAYASTLLSPDLLVLVKGSRSSAMEDIIQKLKYTQRENS